MGRHAVDAEPPHGASHSPLDALGEGKYLFPQLQMALYPGFVQLLFKSHSVRNTDVVLRDLTFRKGRIILDFWGALPGQVLLRTLSHSSFQLNDYSCLSCKPLLPHSWFSTICSALD